MTDPFTIQLPDDHEPVHRSGRFLFRARRGHVIDDHQTNESQHPYLGTAANQRLFRIVSFALLGVLALFLLRTFYLQIGRGAYFRGIAEGNRIRIESIPAARGIIFDRNGIPLVHNAPRFVLVVRPIDVPRDTETEERIAAALAPFDVSRETILDTLNEHRGSAEWISIKEPIPHTEAIELMTVTASLPGVGIRMETRRSYETEYGISLAHILGYLGKPTPDDLLQDPEKDRTTWIGRAGLEAVYESALAGIRGRKEIEVDALHEEKQVLAKEDPQDGAQLILGLDAELQKKSEEVLQKTLEETKKKRGVVIALDPRDGEVRAMVSLPAFDPNLFGGGLSEDTYRALLEDPDHPLFPRATGGTYPSGSTIKPIFAAAALEEGVITPRTTILSTGGIAIDRWFFPDWRAGGHGPTNVYLAIANSVNTFFYYIGGGYGNFEGLGPNRLAVWARRFGLGATTGIDIPGEAAGLVPTVDWKERERNEMWYIGDTYHFAIGQGDVLVTPLQMAVATATIANDGTRYEPRLLHAFRDGNKDSEPASGRIRESDFISHETLAIVREGMRMTVTDGSAKLLGAVPVPVAGKTGTAEWSTTEPTHAWFVGFAPYQNPELAIVVLVEEGGEGSTVAVPIARDILTWYFGDR